jgi:ribosome-binding factor A
MDAPTPRQNKVARLIQKDLSDMFQKFARDWLPGVIISVSTVRISPDLEYAKVYLSIFPTEKGQEVLNQLNEIIKEIRYQLGQRVRNQLRKVPEITLFIDDSLDYINKIDNLLKE